MTTSLWRRICGAAVRKDSGRTRPAVCAGAFADAQNPCGVQNLNKVLQQHLNPPAADKGELTLPGGAVLREGDKVMQIRNNYEKEVFNGDIGA